LQVKLSPQEVEFFAAYDRILSSYAKEYPLFDLTALSQVKGHTLVIMAAPCFELRARAVIYVVIRKLTRCL
jgi:hypothetical protein